MVLIYSMLSCFTLAQSETNELDILIKEGAEEKPSTAVEECRMLNEEIWKDYSCYSSRSGLEYLLSRYSVAYIPYV